VIDDDALAAIRAARDGRRVILAVPDERPFGVVMRDLEEALASEYVNGFEFNYTKMHVKHGSGGAIQITCDRLVKEGRLDGLYFHGFSGGEFLSNESRSRVLSLMRLPEKQS